MLIKSNSYSRPVALVVGTVALVAGALCWNSPANSAIAVSEPGSFVLRGCGLAGNNKFVSLRFNTKTGETWYLDGGTDWLKTIEPEPVPEGDYDMLVLEGSKEYAAIRIDRVKGSSWIIRNKAWAKVNEPS